MCCLLSAEVDDRLDAVDILQKQPVSLGGFIWPGRSIEESISYKLLARILIDRFADVAKV